ncbi:hypothetical protein [Streptomyces syringium]|uniref:hypothetical protein n=1 Tax=Streptomyces syringium TaxID=76729 RepID=UPI003AB07579
MTPDHAARTAPPLTRTRIRPGSRETALLAAARTVLDNLEAPLTAPGRPSRTDPNGWSYGYSPEIDRTSLAWAIAYQLLADHQPDTPALSHVYGADAVLREQGIRGLADLQSNLANGAPIDYAYTRCAYCDATGEDPVSPDYDASCPLCRGAIWYPERHSDQQIPRLVDLLTATRPAKPSLLDRLLRRAATVRPGQGGTP